MEETVIRCELVGKNYQIGERQRYKTLRDSIASAVSAPLRWRRERSRGADPEQPNSFWALRDLSFEVKRGEVLGIIGRNGAGKSTLLKILSRITQPSTGTIDIFGRVGSLLEVGTGFHPELTGRENIFLNGAILGMRRGEIERKFDEIVDFAEIEKFLDTPVKRYSSGMYVRLAFAVAANLEPEILIVDEVLAVGDARFQKKCLGKMQGACREGRTVLFVSHNTAAVEALCSSALLLNAGRLEYKGDTLSVIRRYLSDAPRSNAIGVGARQDREGSGVIRFLSVTLTDAQGFHTSRFRCGADAVVTLEFEARQAISNIRIALLFHNDFGQRILLLDTKLVGSDIQKLRPGRAAVRVFVPHLPLVPGRYDFNIWSTVNDEVADFVRRAAEIDVDSGDYFGTGQLPDNGSAVFVAPHTFECCQPIECDNIPRKTEACTF